MLLFASILLASAVNNLGRFGGEQPFTLPTLEASGTWFRIIGDDSERVRFAPAETRFGIESRSKTDVVFRLRSGPGIPIRARYALTAEGVDFECVNGFALRGKGGAPFITWSDGSVGPGVPAPPAPWYLLSWADARAPLLICVLDQQAALISIESGGEYFVSTEKGIEGRVLVRLPMGAKKVSTKNAAELGNLMKQCETAIAVLQKPSPTMVAETVREEKDGFSVAWKFDLPGAIVPKPVASGGNPSIKITSKTTKLRDDLLVLDGTELSVSFRMNRLLPGAAILTGGTENLQPPLSVRADRPETLGDAALAWLSGITQSAFLRAMERTSESFANDPLKTNYLLRKALGKDSGNDTGALDWFSWRIVGLNEAENAAICCALAMSDKIEDRLAGAMIASTLHGTTTPLADLRREVYPAYGASPANWFISMTSPIRLLTSRGISAWGEGNHILIEGPARADSGISIELHANETLTFVSSANLRELLISNNGPVWTVVGTSISPGIWRIRIARPNGAKPLPQAVQGPSYSAARR